MGANIRYGVCDDMGNFVEHDKCYSDAIMIASVLNRNDPGCHWAAVIESI